MIIGLHAIKSCSRPWLSRSQIFRLKIVEALMMELKYICIQIEKFPHIFRQTQLFFFSSFFFSYSQTETDPSKEAAANTCVEESGANAMQRIDFE